MAAPPQNDPAWGSLGENGPAIDSMLQFFCGVAFARTGAYAMKASGYQVLDGAGTGALKKVCENKPDAASVNLAKGRPNYIASGPIKQMAPSSKRSMGFSAFNSMTGGAKTRSVYFPFTHGVRPDPSTPPRTSAVQSPLWKLPTRMMVSFNTVDEVDARLEWLGDAATARDHRTVTWVMRDRHLTQKFDLSDANLAASAAPNLLVNALKFRLNSPSEGAGPLWLQGMPEVVTPLAQGFAYTYFTPTLPLFSASAEDWNRRGAAAVADIEPPAAPPGAAKADYIVIHPKFDKAPRTFLDPLPRGFDSLSSHGLPTTLGFLYTLAVPTELLLMRHTQLDDATWVSAKLSLKPPQPVAPARSNGPVTWRADDRAVTAGVGAARNLTPDGGLSVAARVDQPLNITGVGDLAKGPGALGLARAGPLQACAALVYRFAGGSVKVAAEGLSQVGVVVESRMPSNDAVSFTAGVKFAAGRRVEYGAGITAEL